MERCRLVFSGSGGQGVITASIILAEAAVLYEGVNAVQSQSYGAQARGGAARADVIISDDEIRFPKVLQPNVLICLSQKAYEAYGNTLRPGGLLLTDSHYVKHQTTVDARYVELDMYQTVKRRIGNPVVFNISVLGAVVALTGLVRPESILKVLEKRVPGDLLHLNKQALRIGAELADGSQQEQGARSSGTACA